MGSFTETLDRLYQHKRFNLIACALIAVLVLIAYSNTFTSSFHFDDNPSIIENASIRHVTSENIWSIMMGVRPVVYLSLMLNYLLGGLNVVGYHVFNIGVHIANSIFFYYLILWTLALPSIRERYQDRAKRLALFAALLFGVHPVHTETVTYIISRTELLATFFYLATFLLFIRGGVSGRPAQVIGMFVTAVLAMGSKEWAVTLPAMLALYDYLFVAERKIGQVLSRWYVYLMVMLTWIVAVHNLDLFSTGGAAGIGFNLVSQRQLTPVSYLYTSFNVLWTYIRLLLLPINQNLDYDYPIAKALFELPTLLSFLGHAAVILGAFWAYRKKGWTLVPFGVAWFYIGISPTQSIVPVVDVIFEHRVYMPSIGFFMVFTIVYEHAFAWWGKGREANQASLSG